MWEFTRIGVTLGARFAQPMAWGELVVEAGGAPALQVFNPVLDETVRVGLSGAGASVLSFAAQAGTRVSVSVGGVTGSLPRDLVQAAFLPGAGSLTGYLAAGSPVAAQAVEVLGVAAGGVRYLAVARPQGSGVELFRVEAGEALVRVTGVADVSALPLAGVAALAAVTVGEEVLLFGGSAREGGVTVMSLSGTGALTVKGGVGVADGVPLAGITAMEAFAAHGGAWLVVASAGTSSLTVFRVEGDGRLVPVEHVFDELGTRFQSVQAMDVLVHGDWVFVVAAGADEGVTLFAMTPEGRVVHLATLADRADLSLANVASLRLVVVDGALQVVALSAAEAGLTVLSVPLSGLGVMGGLTGGAGRDVLTDGAGSDVMAGGAGADVFVLRADGVRDVIGDVDPAVDRIDLGGWAFFRNASQLSVTLTATGAVLRFGAEELELRTASGQALTLAEVQRMVAPLHGRVDLGFVFVEEPPPEDDGGGGGGPVPQDGTPGPDTMAGGAGADTLRGLGSDDSLSGEAGNDSLEGAEGADRLFGGDGEDVLDGGAGNDRLSGGLGADRLIGGDGDDWIEGGEGVDLVEDGAGNDTVLAGAGDESIVAGLGNDSLLGEAGNDTLDGGVGNDRLIGGAGLDRLVGGEGNDWLEGGEGDDVLSGLAGQDVLYGANGRDRLSGGEGNDSVDGGNDADTISGDGGDDVIWGGAGDDSLAGGTGNDRIGAGTGHDTLRGGVGADRLDGGAGNDSIVGEDGNDTLLGWQDADRLIGGAGNDRLSGDIGNDTLTGGLGADCFVFSTLYRMEVDVITDFRQGEDRIELPASVGGFEALTLRSVAGGVEVVADGHVIRLEGQSAAQMDASDFLFV